MPPSDEFKRKLLEPIDALFSEALDSHPPTVSSGGRNYQPPAAPELLSSEGSEPSNHRISKRPVGAPQKVDEKALDEALYAVNSLIGLSSAKRSIRRLADFARIEAERRKLKLPQSEVSFHCVFSGSPGTGKTTLARLLAKILSALGLLQSGHTVEVDKSALVGEFLGQTPKKVQEVFDQAEGGVLFIDEAYSLTHDKEDLYGREAIDMIIKLMEDRRGRVAVVVAGYQKEMREFIKSNPGLRSRFNRTIHFQDYDATELLAIQKQMIRSIGFESSDGLLLRSELMWQQLYRDRMTFDSNGRMVRSALEIMLENQASRLVREPTKLRHELCELLSEDLDGVEQQLLENHAD
jgi:stage V sporulation protein K